MSFHEFREAKEEDISDLNCISLEAKSYWGYPKEWMDKWADELRVDKSHIYCNRFTLIEIDKELAGFCSIGENPDDFEIEHLWLRPKYIGRGYGKLLLNESIARLGNVEKKIVVTSDPNAEEFYQYHGFKTIGKVASFPRERFLPLMEKLQ